MAGFSFSDKPKWLTTGFNIMAVVVGLGLVVIGLYFDKTYYEYGGLAILLTGLVVSWYLWYEEEKEGENIADLFDVEKKPKDEEEKREEEKKDFLKF